MISIIVPIYKVEPYLDKCIRSILNQTYRNLQIILVDDGSPDGCGAICDFYKVYDERVCVIHKTNGDCQMPEMRGLRLHQENILDLLIAMILYILRCMKFYWEI